jgi:hypothetical protein
VTSGQLTAGGVAFAAERGIERVEVSLDLGQTWLPALHETGRPRHTWVRWAARLELPLPGQHQIMARAVDGTNDVQDSVLRRNFPSGASGYHRVLVEWAA